MILKIPYVIIKAIASAGIRKTDFENKIRWSNADEVIDVDENSIPDADMAKMIPVIKTFEGQNIKGLTALIRNISVYEKLSDVSGGTTCSKLDQLPDILKIYLAKVTKRKWLFRVNDEGICSPYYVRNITYTPYNMKYRTPAHVDVSLCYVSLYEEHTKSITFYKKDIGKNVTMAQMLDKANYLVENDDLVDEFIASFDKYRSIRNQLGYQFYGIGAALKQEDDDENKNKYRWRSNDRVYLDQDNSRSKVVMDDMLPEGKKTNIHPADMSFWEGKKVNNNNDDWEEDGDEDSIDPQNPTYKVDDKGAVQLLPVHPYVRVFDLKNHYYVTIHTDNLTPYEWNEKIGEKLVLEQEVFDLINVLIESTKISMEDIIEGKAGGAFILSTGDPGVGKTLTAEVFSEVVHRPLYTVQCSQLGLDVDEVEGKLNKVLNRAQHWGAILVIDEADVYIRARGEDIVQNAIVGVFLRTLEYYKGIIFMTSNRATSIDDAIESRCMAHIKYKRPGVENLPKIWRILGDQFEVELSDKLIKDLTAKWPHIVGRDVKALCKLVKSLTMQKKEKITFDTFERVSKFKKLSDADNIN